MATDRRRSGEADGFVSNTGRSIATRSSQPSAGLTGCTGGLDLFGLCRWTWQSPAPCGRVVCLPRNPAAVWRSPTKDAYGPVARTVMPDSLETDDLDRDVAILQAQTASQLHGTAVIHHRGPGVAHRSRPASADRAAGDSGAMRRPGGRPYPTWVPRHVPRRVRRAHRVSADTHRAGSGAAILQPALLSRPNVALQVPRRGLSGAPYPGLDQHKPPAAVGSLVKDAACS